MGKIYQLKITLEEVKPPVWRRVEVPADIKLDQLQRVILHVMGWGGGHLSSFEIAGEEFFDDEESVEDFGGTLTSKAKLNKYLTTAGQKGLFTYDFGDDWRHEILLEKILPAEKAVEYPRCTAGKRACPPDDCGGPYGYMGFLEAINNPEHPEHEEMLEWIGWVFDAEEFDLGEVNEGLG